MDKIYTKNLFKENKGNLENENLEKNEVLKKV
jgi:hypothetical protein